MGNRTIRLLSRLPLAFGLALVIAFLIPTTGHGDLFISAFNSTLVLTDHPNFYHALADEPTAVFPTGLSGGPYGPLFYYPTAAWLFILDKVQLVDIANWAGTDDETLRSIPSILLLKLPNLAVYVLVAFVLMRALQDQRGEIASALWLANPAVILFSLMMGQNDGWTALASVTALLFGLRALEERPLVVAGRELPLGTLAMCALAIGAAIKLSPILLVPPFAWVLGRSYRERALLAATGLGGFVALVAPFLGTEYFWDHGLLGRQAGQVPDMPLELTPVLYVAYLALVLLASERDTQRDRVLLFSFLAVHTVIYLLPGWSPQRAILFLAVLALAVPIRRSFVLPYLLVTAFALVLALEHRNEIAIGLFGPLSARVALIPPLIGTDPVEPWHSLLYALGGASWVAALGSLWRMGPAVLPAIRWSAAVPILLLATLFLYLGVSASPLPRGVEATPYRLLATPQAVTAGETLSFVFFTARDDLRAVTFRLDERSTSSAAVRVDDGEGRVLFSEDAHRLVPGDNRIDLGRIEEARGKGFRVSMTPSEPIHVRMVRVPEDFVVASAQLDGERLSDAPFYTLHQETTWRALIEDGLSVLGREWVTLAVSVVVGAVVAVGLSWCADRGSQTAG